MKNKTLRIALLHIALSYKSVEANVSHIEHVLELALESEPDLIMMPELAVSGYEFWKEMGDDWIAEKTPSIIHHFARWAKQHRVSLIVGTPTYHPASEKHYNSAILIDENGEVLGQHNKVSVLPGSEGWSTGAKSVEVVGWNGRFLGFLICADAYPPGIAAELAKQGANVLISPAAWAPGLYEPDGEWEQRTLDTGLTMIVCNRTGKENNMNFNGGTTAIVVNGQRAVTYSEPEEAILTIEVDAQTWQPLSNQFDVRKLTSESPSTNL
jgi:predicted amidohydrolase